MPVAMVQVRIVRMTVAQRLVCVRMGMRLGSIPREIVIVLMMLVMTMTMVVCHRFVHVFVLMTFADVQPHTEHHECAGKPERDGRVFAEQQQRDTCTQERRRRKIRTGARRAERAQRQYKKHEAHAVAGQSEKTSNKHMREGRESITRGERDRDVDATGDGTFDRRDLHRVAA